MATASGFKDDEKDQMGVIASENIDVTSCYNDDLYQQSQLQQNQIEDEVGPNQMCERIDD